MCQRPTQIEETPRALMTELWCPSSACTIRIVPPTEEQKWGQKGCGRTEKALLGRTVSESEDERACEGHGRLLVHQLDGLEPQTVKAERTRGILGVFGSRC